MGNGRDMRGSYQAPGHCKLQPSECSWTQTNYRSLKWTTIESYYSWERHQQKGKWKRYERFLPSTQSLQTSTQRVFLNPNQLPQPEMDHNRVLLPLRKTLTNGKWKRYRGSYLAPGHCKLQPSECSWTQTNYRRLKWIITESYYSLERR